jgi:serine/threonine protein kinase
MVLDGFTLVERLHNGGMATLWRVEKPGLDAPMLMKIPQLVNNDDPAAIVGFEVEQMLMPRLSGPHVPRFIAAGDFTSQPYIVMERIAGESLRARLDAAPVPYDEVAGIGIRVATALHDLHRQHVIHLDIKPSNIMFRPDGRAILIDFGLSRHDRLPDLLAEEFRLPMGTGPYISPEQVLGVRNDPRSDLFALGVMLYHFSTGERPFGFPTSVSGLRKRLKQAAVPPRALRPDFPPWLQEVILRCLEVEPDQRYASAAEVAFALQHPDQVALTGRAAQASSKAMASGCDGQRTATVSWPPVMLSSTCGARGNTRVSGPGQHAAASTPAAGGISRTQCWRCSKRARCTMTGWFVGRPLAA